MNIRILLSISPLLLLAGCNEPSGSASPPPPPPPAAAQPSGPRTIHLPPDSPKLQRIRVEAVAISRVPLDEVEAPGRIELNPNRLSRVMMPVAGRVREVMVKLGDAVKEGQPLLSLESVEVSAAVAAARQAQSAITQARANLRKAETDHERTKDLFDGRAVAKKEVLAAENALVQSQTALDQALSASEEAQRRIALLGLNAGDFNQRIVVRAPIAGKVLDLTVAPGEFRNDTAAPLMTIADLSTVWVSSDVPESSIRLISLGEKIEIHLTAFPGETLYARVMRIADVVDPQTRTIRVRAEVDNKGGRLRPEMFCRIRHDENFANVVVAPAAAVVEDESRTMVYLEKSPGVFQETIIVTARKSDALVPVLKGLRAGDRIVVDGAMLLRGN